MLNQLFIVLQQQKMATLHILVAALLACAVTVQGLFDLFSLVSSADSTGGNGNGSFERVWSRHPITLLVVLSWLCYRRT